MDIKELQDKINQSFKVFGFTPFKERMEDIHTEFSHLSRWRDVNNLKEEVGDLLSSLIQLCNETGWDVSDVVENTLQKIERRTKQYQSLGRKTQVAILGGAFDPITKGHIQSAQFVLNTSGEFDEVWLMPAYNHMAGKDMATAYRRLHMCEIAAKVDSRIKVFPYEIENKLAGETYNFFKRLKLNKKINEKFNFSMIIGLDNANNFDKWVNYRELERMVRFVVIPRKGVERDPDVNWYLKEPHIFLNKENDIIEISSTQIRSELKDRHLAPSSEAKPSGLDDKVFEYIEHNNLYTNENTEI